MKRSSKSKMSKYIDEGSETYSSDNAHELSESASSDPWSYEKVMEASEWSSSFGGLKLPHNWNKLERTKKIEILVNQVEGFFPNVPKALAIYLVAAMFPGDCGRHPNEVPDWLDKEKFARGQRFARDNNFGVMYANALSVYVLYSFEDGLKPIIFTARTVNPYGSFKRFLSTVNRIRNWEISDPWTKGTPAYRDIQVVRRLHADARNKAQSVSVTELDKLTKMDKPLAVKRELLLKDFREACPIATPGQCPYLIPEYSEKRPKSINQREMSETTFGFMGLLILYPEAFGIHDATDDDLDAFCHFWRGLTYLLGVSDEFNFCNGSFAEIKERSRDFLDYWVKQNFCDISPEYEHMMRCIHEGLHFHLPVATYDGVLLYLTELLGFEMPRLRASMTYSSWLKFNFVKTIFRYACRFKWIKNYLNHQADVALDRALAFDNETHVELQKKSDKIVADILADISAK